MGTSEPPDKRVGLVILAAGAGTRMRSALPKPLHPVAGVPMIERVMRAGVGARPSETVVVVSRETADRVGELAARHGARTVLQDPALGTGDAARLALDAIADVDTLVVLFSDHPLLEPASVDRLLAGARESRALVTILSAQAPNAAAFGRIVRDAQQRVTRIVERKDDNDAERQGLTEINTGMMALHASWARRALQALQPSPATGEYYLTELVAMAACQAPDDASWPVTAVSGSVDDALGVNDRIDLAYAEARAWQRIRERLMRNGVTMRLPETIVIDEDVSVGEDTVILPYSHLLGSTAIGRECMIGPNALIRDSRIGERVIIRSSTVEATTIDDDSDVGPYSHLRGGAVVGSRVHIGNFAEIKNARLAPGVKVGHFSYIGDATLGAETNVGAGAITANYDGEHKHRTEIGDRAFIGSDTILRAPVRVGDDARTGAGSVVTRDVPDGATVVGVPARIVRRGDRHGNGTEEE